MLVKLPINATDYVEKTAAPRTPVIIVTNATNCLAVVSRYFKIIADIVNPSFLKDMNPETYKKYTGKDVSRLKTNLRALIDYGFADKLLCRIPLIPGYSDEHSQHQSQKELQEMGIGRFDLFTYKTKRS